MRNTINKLLFYTFLCGIVLIMTAIFNGCKYNEINEIIDETELNVKPY